MKALENRSFQDYIYLGYLFLLTLGIVSDAISYGLLGVNIFKYSNIFDIMISPIVFLMADWRTIIFLAIACFIGYHAFSNSASWHEKFRNKKWYKKFTNIEKKDEEIKKRNPRLHLMRMMAFLLMSFYLGTGIGGGSKIKSRIANKDYDINAKIEFQDGKKKKVMLIGSNSSYIFYVKRGDKNVQITPINPYVKTIEHLQ